MNGKLVVITGLDGSGTSTIAQALQEADPGSILLQTPTSPFREIRPTIDTIVREASQESHYLFYLAANVYASQLIQEHLSAGRNVYCVRYLIDTVVSHRAQGVAADLVYETEQYKMRRPDLTVFLTINEQARQRRISGRPGGKGHLDKALDDERLRHRFLTEFQRLSDHFISVDNSDREVSAVVSEIHQYLRITTKVG